MRRIHLIGLVCLLAGPLAFTRPADEAPAVAFPFQPGDRVAWIGSSSTRIGVWPKTMEFLLRTRHPELKLTFRRFTTGGGTFATGLKNLDQWLGEFKPTVVVYNYGGNDAGAGEKGLPAFRDNMTKAMELVKAQGGRPILMTHQSADVRKSGAEPAARRKRYAEAMIAFAREKGYPVVDTHHPLEALQLRGQQDNDAYTILKDSIHLTDAAYVAWGYFLYERLNPPAAESLADLTAQGRVTRANRCKITDIQAGEGVLSFTRADEILPILPPLELPPRQYVPLEKLSRYLLRVTGLPEGRYAITVEGKPLGVADARRLAEGVNLNSLLLDSQMKAPWEGLAKEIWAGEALEQIGRTAWRFEVKRQP